MSTLQEIQNLVNQAQRSIRAGDRKSVQTVLWPAIKSELGQCSDLEWNYRGDMGRLIFKFLNDQDLQSAIMPPINLEKLKIDLKTGGVKADKMKPISPWIPW